MELKRNPAKGSEMQEGTNSTWKRTSKLVLFKTTIMMSYSARKAFMYAFMDQNPQSLKHGMYILPSVLLVSHLPIHWGHVHTITSSGSVHWPNVSVLEMTLLSWLPFHFLEKAQPHSLMKNKQLFISPFPLSKFLWHHWPTSSWIYICVGPSSSPSNKCFVLLGFQAEPQYIEQFWIQEPRRGMNLMKGLLRYNINVAISRQNLPCLWNISNLQGE